MHKVEIQKKIGQIRILVSQIELLVTERAGKTNGLTAKDEKFIKDIKSTNHKFQVAHLEFIEEKNTDIPKEEQKK